MFAVLFRVYQSNTVWLTINLLRLLGSRVFFCNPGLLLPQMFGRLLPLPLLLLLDLRSHLQPSLLSPRLFLNLLLVLLLAMAGEDHLPLLLPADCNLSAGQATPEPPGACLSRWLARISTLGLCTGGLELLSLLRLFSILVMLSSCNHLHWFPTQTSFHRLYSFPTDSKTTWSIVKPLVGARWSVESDKITCTFKQFLSFETQPLQLGKSFYPGISRDLSLSLQARAMF